MGRTKFHAVSLMIRAQILGQMQYRVSLWTELLGQLLYGVTEFAEIYILLHVAPVFGQLNFSQAALLFGITSSAFGIADMIFGQLDRVDRLIKDGELEVLLTRPTSLVVQLITSNIELRRLGRATFGVAALLLGFYYARVPINVSTVLLTSLAVAGGVLIFGALFLFAGCVLFWILDGSQAVNAFSYGGKYVAQAPGSVLREPIRSFYTFVVPATLIGYVPATVLSGAPLPPPWWSGTAWLTVPIGLMLWLGLLWFWRNSVRHYTGAGG